MENGKRDHIRFLLDGEMITLRDFDPNTTLLNWLRDTRRRKGSKEGCAEGDCGACTVVLAETGADGEPDFYPVNACIRFLPTLDGKMLFTVESLKALNEGRLHPVQQAMVDCHASQCGFCTPGFVMSLFALFKTRYRPPREAVITALSGNLCRCTGYRPILDAGVRMYDLAEGLAPIHRNALNTPAAAPDQPEREPDRLTATLQDLAQSCQDGFEITHRQRRFLAPATLEALARTLQQHPQARILAGGTDVGLQVTKQHRDLDTLVWPGKVRELQQIGIRNGQLAIGANVLLEQAFAAITRHYPQLTELHQRFASLPIRSSGTLIGNIANGSPIGDSMPALITLGATVILRRGEQLRTLALEDFYLGYQQKDLQPGEFIQALKLPLPHDDALQLRCWKISKRFEQDISAVCAAFTLSLKGRRVDRIRIALGGMAAIPQRAHHCETALTGQIWNRDNIAAAQAALAQDFSPISDMRASAAYRLQVAQNLLLRFYLETEGNAVSVHPVEASA
ncbi:MAG: xanthine dehydrogenase small subunit [Thiothrix sp.]|nr:xanthine dehydrogenase small subunit [Thiothrix sp.]